MNQPEAMVVSILIEAPIVLLLSRLSSSKDSAVLVGLVAVAATLITHPFAWWGNVAFSPLLSWIPRIAFIETGVFIVEGVVFAIGVGWSVRKGLLLSFLANLTSTLFGIVWFRWIAA